ncbi:hypothetical protein FLA_4927 [Filimonas lacunae]|nr:hypothetical protein FLA_4927 [Filimonas lacunae]
MLLLQLAAAQAQTINVSDTGTPESLLIAGKGATTTIYTDAADAAVVQVAANALQKDIQLLTGQTPAWQHSTSLSNTPIIIGTIGKSALINKLVASKTLQINNITGLWEAFTIQVIDMPVNGKKTKALVIAGSDRRGTAFGVFELSRKMGVSPLYWWADVIPAKRKNIFVNGQYTSKSPSVQYRGIFINDEDWGLQPWAARNLDSAVKDIGPRTYERVFELMLRLKANYIWPAMHPCTKAFYYYAENPQLAEKYAIIVGGSHCEPMLRNNVFEWTEHFEKEYGQKPGEWRYDVNKDQIYTYWKDRVIQSAQYENVYTVGMRGIHDGSMPGPKDVGEKVKLLGNVIQDQRTILSEGLHKAPAVVPQIFCPYKEVLTLYQRGLQLPDDVTIVWADDNHGYIRQLSTPAEQQRSGGSGVYYHLSYWGAPHDYLWLSTISPALISFELSKAWQYNARKAWIINVGDIKPAEMEMQFTFDLAWDVQAWPFEKAVDYTQQWARETFGPEFASDIARIKNKYYQLAAAGKPEHLGMRAFSEQEADRRLLAYRRIAAEAGALQQSIPARLQNAYFELVYYPIVGACLMNEKTALAAKSRLYAQDSSNKAALLADSATAAFEQIKALTQQYNTTIAGGKWNGIMSWHPRDLPVFQMPPTSVHPDTSKKGRAFCNIDTQSAPLLILAANSFTQKQEQQTTLQSATGLGYTANSITCLPVTAPSLANNEWEKASNVSYSATLPAGKRTIQVRALPTHRQYTGRGVRYAIGIDNNPPQVIDLEEATDNATWKLNVVNGYAQGQTEHEVTAGNHIIHIYFMDPGLVLNDISIY